MRVNNERHARDEQLLKLSRHDPLTGELNRTHLIAALAEAIEEASRFRSSFAFMLIGIDHLARINDAFGFDVADAVIAEVAKRIRARLRGGDVLGRFSGNKFGLILKNCTVDDINIAAERFLAGIRDEVVPTRSGPVSVTASIGAVSVRVTRGPPTKRSTGRRKRWTPPRAAAPARSRCGSRCRARRPAPRQHPRHRRDRHRAERAPRSSIAFEPVVDARSRAAGVLRMPGADGAGDGQVLLAPDIVPVAEKLGLIRLVDHRVLELVIAELAAVAGVSSA